MKRSRALSLSLMAAVPALLTACDGGGGAADYARGAGELWCADAAAMFEPECKAALAQAVDTAPTYADQQQCQLENGEGCVEVNRNGENRWIGPIAGFVGGMVLAEAIDELGDAYKVRRRHAYSYPVGGYRRGYNTPAYRSYPTRPVSAPPPVPPSRAVTMSRSGFGSSSAARSSFGG